MFDIPRNYTQEQNWVALFGRVLISFIFVLSGIVKIIGFTGTVHDMESMGIMFHPQLLAAIAIIFELGGGLLVLLGWHERIGAALLLIFTVAVSFVIHHFWSYPVEHSQTQMVLFLKNVAISGGLLYIIAFGAGDFTFRKFFKKSQ